MGRTTAINYNQERETAVTIFKKWTAVLNYTQLTKSGYQNVSITLFLRYDNVSRLRSPNGFLCEVFSCSLTVIYGNVTVRDRDVEHNLNTLTM